MIAAGLIHILLSVLIALGFGWIFGELSPFLAGFSLLSSSLLTWKIFPVCKSITPRLDKKKSDFISIAVLVFLSIAALRHFVWLLYFWEGSLHTLSINNLGDLPLHINYIRQFAGGASIPPVNPEFASQPLYYPYAIDFYNSLWENLGIPLNSHLFLVGLFLFIAACAALWNWAGWLGLVGFFLNGGWAGWQIFQTGDLADYQAPLAWKNFFLSLFITQRGIMFAVPAGLIILSVLHHSREAGSELKSNSLLLTGFLWGGLAFFHLHSFVAISLILGGYAMIFRNWQALLQAAKLAVPLGSFFVLYSTQFFQKASAVYLQWGWMAQDESLAGFWWTNLGPWLLLFAMLAIVLVRRQAIFALQELSLYFFLFALFTWVMLAPWDWDNIKVLIWPYLGILGIAWRNLTFLQFASSSAPNQRYFAALSPILLAIVLGFSGTVSVTSSLSVVQNRIAVYSTPDLWNTQGSLQNLPADAAFLAAPTYNHPLTFWGRIRVLGYEGHTWSHGIDSTAISQSQRAVYAGDSNWQQLLEQLGATHIVYGPQERAYYGNHNPPWTNQLRNISVVPQYEIYAVE